MGGDLCLTLKTMFWCSFHPVSQVWLWNGREGGREGDIFRTGRDWTMGRDGTGAGGGRRVAGRKDGRGHTRLLGSGRMESDFSVNNRSGESDRVKRGRTKGQKGSEKTA